MGYLGRDTPYFQPSFSYLNSVTWIAPYYRSFSGIRSIYYRETNESSLLFQVNNDIQRNSLTSFIAKNLFLVTYISQGMKFQITLATDGTQTFAVMNYEELSSDPATNIDMNEPGCGYKVFFPRLHSAKTLINGKRTGVRGRHVFNLTTPGCYKNVNGLRVAYSSFRFSHGAFHTIDQKFPSLLKANEIGEVLFHLKEPIAPSMDPFIINNLKKIANKPSSRFAIFYPVNRFIILSISNLFVLKNTSNSLSFQHGEFELGLVASQTKCREIQFEERMKEIPAVKVNARVDGSEIKNYVNVWLKNVSSVGFTACVKEMVTFSGKRQVNISYVAVTSGSEFAQESTHFIHESIMDDLSNTCVDRNLQNEYLTTPYVFTAIETVGQPSTKDEPVLVWIKTITKTKATVCVRSSQKAKYRIHLIIKGTISPCSSFSCPNHLECQLTSRSTPYCGCIQNCAKYNDTRDFCGSDFKNYQSICLMHKDHCQRYGNKSKSNVTINHYGKCQGMFFVFLTLLYQLLFNLRASRIK